ncbi:hypothetical protein Vadar_026860 [Vaccinium darrowii]|uniref:Uncharacterized protein n=1 Tax=Vaccinium darrowii TaxID=229202 RepID=A0ACB7ZMQ6_9ERIC|nr:hypothetical protein Vadar_026860 [Vaccinium darrowii]
MASCSATNARSSNLTCTEDSLCHSCSGKRIIQASWTTANPGRRFISGPKNECDDFGWFDPPMCNRSTQIIPGLLRKINRLEGNLMACKARERKLWTAVVVSWVLIAIVWCL